MSSRALRRAQKEQEERELQEKLARLEQDDEESENEVAPKPQAKPSLFAMLPDAGDDAEEEEGEEEEDDDEKDQDVPPPEPVVESTPTSNPSKKSKKKRKKGKNKSKTATPQRDAADSSLDEIDQALLALKVTSSGKKTTEEDLAPAISEETQQLFSALSIDTTHLHAANEMKKLFGRAALQHDGDEPRQRQQQGIAARVAGRNQPGSRLTGLSLRRNIFIQGKEEWPRATSGGLGMEVVEKRADGSVEYRFVHNTSYQETQRQFQVCVASMDPERMVQLLHHNPYHISTLLQVSEIAKQQRDNASASDLLERALFTFGRSVHSTFHKNLSAGKARLSFSRPENREFFLAIWRYIATLGVRATWRTALEWARLLLSLSPEDDPYCIRLLIDQIALRGRDPQSLIVLAQSDILERSWKIPPNLAFSISLAHLRLKQPVEARTTLKNAVKQYPWLAARLCKELDISPIPKPVWGREPTSDFQDLLARLYTLRARDLWNTTETTSLLVEICYTVDEPLGDGAEPYWLAPINELDLARHVILSDDQSLISLLDTRVKEKYTSVSDPLPPEENMPSYDVGSASSFSSNPGGNEARGHQDRAALLSDLEQLQQYFQSIDIEGLVGGGLIEENLVRALQEGGSSLDEFRRNSERFQVVRARLQDLGMQVVFEGEGVEGTEGATQEEGSGSGSGSNTDE